MRNLLAATTLLAALLFAGATQAQQMVVKTKTKSAKNGTNAASTPPHAPPVGGPAGPQRPGGPNAGPGPLPGGPDGGPGHGHRGPHGPGPKGGPGSHGGPRGGQVRVLADLRGTLTAYQALNDEQVYDAFVLRADSGAPADTVRFPRHLGQQLMAAAASIS